MAGHHLSCSNTSSRLKPPNNLPSLASTPGWSYSTKPTGVNNLKYPHARGSHCMDYRNPLENFEHPSSSITVKKICMGQPYMSKCVEANNMVNRHNVVKKSASSGNPPCLLCTNHPKGPSSPTFLDQLIKGINYLDRSTNVFSKKSSLSLPKLAVNCLERAANSIYQDHQEKCCSHANSNVSSSLANEDTSSSITCIVSPPRKVRALEYVDNSSNTSCARQFYSRKVVPPQPQRPGIKLPEVPLFGNSIFSLGQLPKFWEAIHSGWGDPEPISKPSSWW